MLPPVPSDSAVWSSILPSTTVHIVYNKAVQGTDDEPNVAAVLNELGLKALNYFVTPDETAALRESIPLGDIVFVHMDPPCHLPVDTEMAPQRLLERSFVYVMGFPHELTENCVWKSRMNAVFAARGVPHCPTVRIDGATASGPLADALAPLRRLACPLFVKVDSGMNSEALRAECVATTPEDALAIAASIAETHTAAVVQEYLAGREFTVAVVGPPPSVAMHPIERIFARGEKFSPIGGTRRERAVDAAAEPALVAECRALAVRAFDALNTTKAACYGRVDMRHDADGRLRVLEVNDTCGFSEVSYFELSCAAAGTSRACVMAHILQHKAREWTSIPRPATVVETVAGSSSKFVECRSSSSRSSLDCTHVASFAQ